ncbi:rod shape-determining protein MreD [Pullulanibacillus sp. KACC 23026]|uniref:rod shape-determining protein MreD n=1 Tax=Pullulanibacillus sp. KACC 23026 TaxID=3028315 RepID=UPI0023AFA169|nr:rod shape-determining protein MreD [Pullulanibacillus sp. KACC 23026]WEG14052.1 rod shape-determining protein MreD [Pullulanibacillus sp. KACC 23026]
MRAIFLFVVMFVLFLLQGTVFQIFTPEWFGYHFDAIPHLVLIGCCFISMFAGRSTGIKYAIVFGFLLDLTSSNILGVYAFCLGLTTYLLGFLARWIHLHLVSVFLLILLAIAALEIEVYGIYFLIHKATMSFDEWLVWRLPPTLILNGCLTILLFYPLRRFLLQLVPDQTEE